MVSVAWAPLEIQYFTRSASILFSSVTRLYVPSISWNLPLFVEFFESVKTTRKIGICFRATRCNRIFSMAEIVAEQALPVNFLFSNSPHLPMHGVDSSFSKGGGRASMLEDF